MGGKFIKGKKSVEIEFGTFILLFTLL